MKKQIFEKIVRLIFVIFVIPVFTGNMLLFPGGQETKQKRIVEKVTVTNVEVPVRVLYKGKPITGLTIDDFTVYENRKEVKINGFFTKTKTLTFTQTAKVMPEPRPISCLAANGPPRKIPGRPAGPEHPGKGSNRGCICRSWNRERPGRSPGGRRPPAGTSDHAVR